MGKEGSGGGEVGFGQHRHLPALRLQMEVRIAQGFSSTHKTEKGRGRGGQFTSGSPKWNGQWGKRGIHCIEQYSNEISRLKSVTPQLSSK